MVSLFYVHKNFRTRSFLPDTDGRHKVGPQVPPEVAVDPEEEEEEAEAESMQEINRETVYGSESTNRPSALEYGSGNAGGYGYGISSHGGYRPSGYGGSNGYGISGTLADGDEFGPGDSAYPDGSVSQHPGSNLHAQKAVALKALAGVALIGAAAALASNPVLLPIGIVGGRRKRSETFSEAQNDYQMDYILNMLKKNLYKIQKDSSTNRLIVSPRCVARLTCEIQKDYLSDVDKDVEILNTNRKYHLTNLIRNNVLNIASLNANVKNLIKLAVDVAMENKNCNVFTCNYLRKT
ncbi:hypothetical protein RF55_5584 [Lasius niger]|uniref:Uncharacterized protein n=1 Tax=Lasius niger TaxID=67767 RepID=A0A0J7NP53_LASNI|nr:hypothetical protein RF55_5584 [Lasius niger]